jgi:uncharacterized protein YqjF (DUF2071 family)
MVDRLAIRARPPGRPLMHQHWDRLLFLHWPVPEALLRPLIPPRLAVDTFDGAAWVGVVPFTMWGIRPAALPALPGLSASHELNVRTYVHLDGVPGVWFFSLDASNPLLVWGARLAFHLPYFRARMGLEAAGPSVRYHARRTHAGAPPAAFEATWSPGTSLPEAQPGTLGFFLTERYCLYAARGGRLLRTRVHHRPWPLCEGRLAHLASSMLEAQGLPAPGGPPLAHALAAPLPVEVWRPRAV